MGEPEGSLEGWVPRIGGALTLERVIELAFDYRGNTTVVRIDGTEVVGYLYNREASAPEPYIQVFDDRDGDPVRIPYREIRTINFTGRDTAHGKSYGAWLARRRDAPGAGPGDETSKPGTTG
jgi:hypothetical protein